MEAKALSLLAMRDHGEGELRKKLKERYYREELIDAVIERFKSYNYIDDARTSERLARGLVRQGWGPMKVRIKMRNKSYSAECIDVVMEKIEEEDTWLTGALERVRSKFHKEPEELEQAEKEKAYRHLAYRGYPGGVIRDVLFRS